MSLQSRRDILVCESENITRDIFISYIISVITSVAFAWIHIQSIPNKVYSKKILQIFLLRHKPEHDRKSALSSARIRENVAFRWRIRQDCSFHELTRMKQLRDRFPQLSAATLKRDSPVDKTLYPFPVVARWCIYPAVFS